MPTIRRCTTTCQFQQKSKICSNTLTSNNRRIQLFLLHRSTFRYQPQDIVLETKLKPFIPEYVPAIGDIDAFLKVPRPDGKEDSLGLVVLDEPSSSQSDPHILNLQMRYTSKQPMATSLPTVRCERSDD